MYLSSHPRIRQRGIGDFSALANAIQTMEGWFPGSVSYRNNNPGNLMYVGQSGAIGQDANGFAIFPDYQTGYNALLNQISLDASRGQTLSQFTASYAPAAAGNDPTSYAAFLASQTGLSVSDPLSLADTSSGTSSGFLSAGMLPLSSLPSLDVGGFQISPLLIGAVVLAGVVLVAARR
jgi:hypothetical protein